MTNRFEHIPEATFVEPIDGENESSYEDLPSEKIRKALFDAVVQMGEANGVPQEHLVVSGHDGTLYKDGVFDATKADAIDANKRSFVEEALGHDADSVSAPEVNPAYWTTPAENIMTDDVMQNPVFYATENPNVPGAISLYDKRTLEGKYQEVDEGVYGVPSAEDLLQNTSGILRVREQHKAQEMSSEERLLSALFEIDIDELRRELEAEQKKYQHEEDS